VDERYSSRKDLKQIQEKTLQNNNKEKNYKTKNTTALQNNIIK